MEKIHVKIFFIFYHVDVGSFPQFLNAFKRLSCFIQYTDRSTY